jgi:high affinity Mn2+ porin
MRLIEAQVGVVLASCALLCRAVHAQSTANAAPDATADPGPRFALHAQATYVEQETDGFHAPYRGTNSLTPSAGRETVDATLYLGARLWQGAEAWVNPELDQGFGLDNTLGLAAFSSAEAYKVGANAPYFRLQRVFVRQTVDLSGSGTLSDAAANQFALWRTASRWVFTVGKFSITDLFDVNRYAHDPRNDFLNWAAIDAGTFDYAADSWGYTVGAAAEWYQGAWALRGGIFDLSDIPNSPRLESGFDEFQLDFELEHRHQLLGRPGKLMLTAFDSRGRMGLLSAALALGAETGTPPDVALVRSYRSRIGAHVSLEQELTDTVGLFARVGKAPGNTEIYEFTDIDRTVSAGLSFKGALWERAADTIGVAAIVDGISAEREAYLNAGGLGILIGDGKLPHPGAEQIGELYYSLGLRSWLHVTLDSQFVKNPAYNTDRGPVSVCAVRVHLQY